MNRGSFLESWSLDLSRYLTLSSFGSVLRFDMSDLAGWLASDDEPTPQVNAGEYPADAVKCGFCSFAIQDSHQVCFINTVVISLRLSRWLKCHPKYHFQVGSDADENGEPTRLNLSILLKFEIIIQPFTARFVEELDPHRLYAVKIILPHLAS